MRGRTRWALLLVLVIGILVVALPLLAAYVIEAVVIPRLNQRYGVLIQVDRVQVRPTRVRLVGLSVRAADVTQLPPPLRSGRCEVEFAPLALLSGRVELTTVTLDRASIQLSRGGEEDNVSALLTKLRSRAASTEAPTAPGRKWLHGPETVVFTSAELEVRDDLGSVRAAAMDATLRRQGDCEVSLREAVVEPASGTRASADEVSVRWRSPERFLPVGLPEIQLHGGAVAPWKRLAMTGIRGTVKPDPSDGARAVIELFGGYGGVEKELWQAHGWVRPQADGPWSKAEAELGLRAESFRLSQLEPILRDTPVIDADKTEVAATLELKFGQGALSFDGKFQMKGLSFFSSRLVAEPVRNLAFDLTGKGRLELKTRKIRLERATVKWNGAEVDLDAEAEAQARPKVVLDSAAGVQAPGWRERWRTIALHIVVPPIDCQAMLAAMPQPIVPRIKDFKLAGTFSTDVRVFVDFAKLLRLPPPKDPDSEEGGADALTPTAAEPPPPVVASKKGGRRGSPGAPPPGTGVKDPKDDPVQVSGQVGINGCRVLKAPSDMEATRFLKSFTHTVLVEPGRELSFVIGPENPDYVSYEELSPYLLNSIMTTEDNGFLRHRGFITPEFRSALQSNLERGYFRVGASSITMQLVKNVLLSREKTLSRKLQELFLTWYLETNLSDDEELIKALNKGFSLSQYRQQQAKLKKLVPADPIISAGGPEVAAPEARTLPTLPTLRTAAEPVAPAADNPAAAILATAKPFDGAPTGPNNLYAVAQARQALREISPIKKRILEIYFNAIEFGPYIYGIGRAARHYFGKSAKDLNPREASFFSSILPNPKRRYIQYCKGAADDAWEKYVDRIVRRVHSRGRLTDEELQQAVTSRLVFDRAESLPERDCLALIQHLTELPSPTPAAASGEQSPALPVAPPVIDRSFVLPPWITTSSSGRLHYRPGAVIAPAKPEPIPPEPVPF